jgi:hypothetical protein
MVDRWEGKDAERMALIAVDALSEFWMAMVELGAAAR